MAKRALMKLLFCLTFAIATAGMAAANVPELMVYSGAIPQGVNQGDGTYEVSFSIYASAQGGSPLWTETQNVYVYQGTFAVYLGAVQKLNLAFDGPYWVGVKTGDKEDIRPLTGAGYPFSVSGAGASAGNAAIAPTAVAADEVMSANIREADGTTGQNANTGSGIKTAHIQNAAVTAVKIKANAVTTGKIADGAVTDAKITGPISVEKIDTTGLNSVYVNVSGDTMTGALKLPANGLVAGTNQLVLAGGKVGVGTAAPAYKLDVAGTANLNKGVSGGALYVNGAEALWFNGTYFSWGYGGQHNYFADKVGIGTTAPTAKLHVETSEGTAFYASGGNSSADFAGFFDGRAYMSGSLVLGGTPGVALYKLVVNGNAYATGTWGGSDIRWKKNIATLESSLKKVLQLRGVSYDWNTEEYPDKGFTQDRQIGLIAQEVEPVIPEVVNTGLDGYKSLAYDRIVAVLVEAVKEQQAQIEELKAEMAELKR